MRVRPLLRHSRFTGSCRLSRDGLRSWSFSQGLHASAAPIAAMDKVHGIIILELDGEFLDVADGKHDGPHVPMIASKVAIGK